MKKLLVLALAVVLTLSLTVVASAATFDPYVGGEFQLIYSSDALGDETPLSSTFDNGTYARYKAYVMGKVSDEETGTWARVGMLSKVWAGDANLCVYEAGIKGIGDVLDIWYTNDENPNTKRGQVAIAWAGGPSSQPPLKFGGDPGFSNGIGGDALGFDFNNDNVTINLVYDPNEDANGDPLTAIAATFKFDGGNVWVGTRNRLNDTNGDGVADSEQTGVGMQYGFGFGTLSVDYITETPEDGDDMNYAQANMNFTDLGLDVTLLIDDGKFFGEDGGMGIGANYNIGEKYYVGAKLLSPDYEDAEDLTEYYFGIKHGVLETRIGSYDTGEDSFFYATVHAGLW